MEALRRLRRSSTDTNVDRRLVTNMLISYLTTPRGDSKRFEMLSLLASILQWTDDERENAGLQRKGGLSPGSATTGSSLWGRASGKGKGPEQLEKTDETEVRFTSPLCQDSALSNRPLWQSFSRLWVEFLLTEAAAGEGATPMSPRSPNLRTNSSLPPTPTKSSNSGSPVYLSPGSQKGGRRLPSFSLLSATSSSPSLSLSHLPENGKGKERATE